MTDTTTHTKKNATPGNASPTSPALSEKQRRDLWLYIAACLMVVEMLVTVGAVFYGFISAPSGASGANAFVFPWIYWGVLTVVLPALILLLVHVADVGLFTPPGGARSEQEWQKLLPQRLQKFYRVVKGAPVAVVLVGVVLLGAALLTIDGALSALSRFGAVLAPYVPHIVGGIACVLCVIVIAVVWLNYRTRRLIAEYAFRREVLEKTGVIIVDKGSTPLPPGGIGDVPYAIVSGENLDIPQAALPAGKETAASGLGEHAEKDDTKQQGEQPADISDGPEAKK